MARAVHSSWRSLHPRAVGCLLVCLQLQHEPPQTASYPTCHSRILPDASPHVLGLLPLAGVCEAQHLVEQPQQQQQQQAITASEHNIERDRGHRSNRAADAGVALLSTTKYHKRVWMTVF